MDISDLESKRAALVESAARVRNSAIGLVAEREFARARAHIADLAGYIDYADWLDAREGLQIGLSMAGIDAAIVRVDLSSFLEWRDLTGASSDERALDAFAAVALNMRNARAPKVFAIVSEFDFATRSLEVAPFAGRRDYRGWARHRRAKTIAAGSPVERLPVRLDSFIEWCACLRQRPSEAALDRYAELLLEHLTSDAAGSA